MLYTGTHIGHVEMAWTDESTSHLFWHALPVDPIVIARRDWSPLTSKQELWMTNGIHGLPCDFLYHSSHWICHPRRGRLFVVHVFNSFSHFWINAWHKTCTISLMAQYTEVRWIKILFLVIGWWRQKNIHMCAVKSCWCGVCSAIIHM